MSTKILTLTLLLGALCVAAYAQETPTSTDNLSGSKKDAMAMSDGKTVSPADAAKTRVVEKVKSPPRLSRTKFIARKFA